MALTDVLVVLDRQHGFKSATFDPGAVDEVDGTKDVVAETELTRAYIAHACARLDDLGVPWTVLGFGPYGERHALASKAAWGVKRVAYIACHVNAGGGAYGLVKHDTRSSGGRKLALALTSTLVPVSGLASVKALPLRSDDRGWSCISGIYDSPSMCAALFEPYFIDHEAHAHLREGKIIGRALADGCASWLRGG